MRLRYVCPLVFLTVFLVVPTVRADDLAIGVIDMTRISQEYRRYQVDSTALEDRKAELQDIVDREEETIMRLIDDLDSIRATASNATIQERRNEIEERDRQLRQFVERTNSRFRSELEALQTRTQDEIREVVEATAETLELDLVLEKNLLLYFDPEFDLTDRIITRLNIQYPPPVPGSEPNPLSDVAIPDFGPPEE